MKEKSFQAAVYLRLSREDGDVTDGGKTVSNSIANQNELVMDYLKSHPEIKVVDTYTDDGFSGVNFERPEFQRMLPYHREGTAGVRRHIVGGANRTLISVTIPPRPCRTGTCRRLQTE